MDSEILALVRGRYNTRQKKYGWAVLGVLPIRILFYTTNTNIISNFRGADLVYRNKKPLGIVLNVQPKRFCLGWAKDAL